MTTVDGTAGIVDHLAVPYARPEQLADRLEPVLDTALAAGDPVLAVLDGPERDALRTRLGTAARRVEFAAPADVHAVPAFTVAVRWARLARGLASGRVLVVGQHLDLPGSPDAHWPRLDMAVDVAIAGLPITVLCPCGESDPTLDTTHPLVLTATGRRTGAGYRAPLEAVVGYPPPPPPDLGPSAVDLPFGLDDLSAVRRRTAEAGAAAGLAPDRVADFVLAVNELATNSVEHGAGAGRLRVWTAPGLLTVEVADHGRMDVPFPGLVPPSPTGQRGRGLWLASELSDVLEVWSDPTGTVIRARAW
ncbi:ATP-binding protein [Pseudonocardia broussonetiae]|uniref:Histidine kinase/HSP90-like ATPase domain-containing protein n=1 Tax=Pseudonocardia broussonetiae TaxID=2736640 RepID=A0A6M6JFF1_9PSEU|nr:ATP-binding protein [Pseudonocardia broussonetiae]QJY45780.1 hypothetical protein HOP40_08200 [Pseudonocardia broussonetiae]